MQGPRPENVLYKIHEVVETLVSEFFRGVVYDLFVPCVDCLRTGAERFGWNARNDQPGKTRDGRWLVGMGVAAAFSTNMVM